jgi:ElaB/YqjD/DUF883 family membrane-anchored ribosome-binding protein
MSDVSTPETRPELNHVEVDSMISTFTRTRRSGYLEEDVDQKLKKFSGDVNVFVDAYNALVRDYNDVVTKGTGSMNSQAEEELANRSAELFKEAQRTARDHINTALERADNIVADAEADATTRRAALESELTERRSAADTELAEVRAAAQAEISDAYARLERETNAILDNNARLREEARVVLDRMRAFHQTQIASLDAVAYQITPELDRSEEAVEAPEVVDDLGSDALDEDPAGSDADEAYEVATSPVSDAASEPETFSPDVPVEAPEASTSGEVENPSKRK